MNNGYMGMPHTWFVTYCLGLDHAWDCLWMISSVFFFFCFFYSLFSPVFVLLYLWSSLFAWKSYPFWLFFYILTTLLQNIPQESEIVQWHFSFQENEGIESDGKRIIFFFWVKKCVIFRKFEDLRVWSFISHVEHHAYFLLQRYRCCEKQD